MSQPATTGIIIELPAIKSTLFRWPIWNRQERQRDDLLIRVPEDGQEPMLSIHPEGPLELTV